MNNIALLQTTNKELRFCEVMSACKTLSIWSVYGASFYMTYYVGLSYMAALYISHA